MNFISENPFIFIILTTIVIMFTMLVIDQYIYKKRKQEEVANIQEEENTKKQDKKVKITPVTPYKELMEILDNTINQELYFWLQLTVNMKDVKIIDFAETVQTITHRVYDGLSPEFIDDLKYYHDEEWIMGYLVRRIKIYVTDYIRKHPVS